MLDAETLKIIGSLIAATAYVIWKVTKTSSDIKDLIHALDKKVTIIETKTINVSADHDTLVLVEAKAEAAHNRLDAMSRSKERACNE